MADVFYFMRKCALWGKRDFRGNGKTVSFKKSLRQMIYQMAYSLMPSQAASCPDAKQMYINGHFCYADKSVGDASALVPVLKDFFSLHPDFHPDTFLGDSAFDSATLYGTLMNDFHLSITYKMVS